MRMVENGGKSSQIRSKGEIKKMAEILHVITNNTGKKFLVNYCLDLQNCYANFGCKNNHTTLSKKGEIS